jgi:hypothetical protein
MYEGTELDCFFLMHCVAGWNGVSGLVILVLVLILFIALL